MKYWLSSWNSLSAKDSATSFISENGKLVTFDTKKSAREYINEHCLPCVIIEKIDEKLANEIKRQKIKIKEIK